MEYKYELLFQGQKPPRELGDKQTIHGVLTAQCGEEFHNESFASIRELEERGSLSRRLKLDGKMVYFWATPVKQSA